MTDHDHITTLKAAADPQRIAASLGLRSKGKRFFCPACQSDGGKTPDLSVGGKGFFCFKCGLKGDLLKLIEVAGNMDFPSAVAWLERETGIRPPDRRRGGYQDKGRVGIVHLVASRAPLKPASETEIEFGDFADFDKLPAGVFPSIPSHNTPALAAADPVKVTGSGPDSAVYEAFLTSCRPVEGCVLDWLTKGKGIAPDVVIALGLRFCGREYKDIMDALQERFGEDALLVAGLLKRSKAVRLVPSFWYYFAKETGFLVIPYLKDGRPVYLKARPPVSKEGAERRELVRFMNTAAAVPCLYNVDALKGQPDKVMICEGESDTWTALSNGWAAVGSPGAKGFKAAWVEGFRGLQDADGRSTVYLVLDADKAGAEGSRVIADLFLKAGLPVPLRIMVPSGKDLTDFMKEGRT